MGTNEETNTGTNEENGRGTEQSYSEIIEMLYDEGLKRELLYKDMFEMDLSELANTIQQRKQGLAYKIWRLSSFVRHPFVKEFPDNPKEAMPELFPPAKTIPMPDFLKEKYYKRKGVKINE